MYIYSLTISLHVYIIVPGPVQNLMKMASSAISVTISWDPPEPSDGYTNISGYIIRYGELDTTGEIVTSEYTQETINNLRRYNHCIIYIYIDSMYVYTHLIFHAIEPGIPYYVAVSASTTGGNGNETKLIVFSKEEGS